MRENSMWYHSSQKPGSQKTEQMKQLLNHATDLVEIKSIIYTKPTCKQGFIHEQFIKVA